MTKQELAERVYETAVAYKAAEDDAASGKWVLAARWGEYTKALQDHAQHFIRHYLKENAK